jgi:hypothetical protein
VANGNYGALLLLFYTIMTYLYAAVMLFVFYYLPKKSGLVVDITLLGDDAKIDVDKAGLGASLVV